MNVTHIFELLILLISAILSAFLIPYIKAKVGQDRLNKIMLYVEIAVDAAEQIFDKTQGAEKKEYVLKYLEGVFEANGMKVDMETLSNMIEAQVLQLHDQLKESEE